jgi:hypothetical protein
MFILVDCNERKRGNETTFRDERLMENPDQNSYWKILI